MKVAKIRVKQHCELEWPYIYTHGKTGSTDTLQIHIVRLVVQALACCSDEDGPVHACTAIPLIEKCCFSINLFY